MCLVNTTIYDINYYKYNLCTHVYRTKLISIVIIKMVLQRIRPNSKTYYNILYLYNSDLMRKAGVL